MNCRAPLSLALLLLALPSLARAEEASPSAAPKVVPATRPAMKQALEDLKKRSPRIPPPELSADEQARLGERGQGIESRLRAKYLPASDGRSAEFGREPDPHMSLSYEFKTRLFWIVSRTNNCHYCMGHQEIKLALAGLREDEIAALDGDWAEFTPAEQAAFRFARRLTFEPHLLADADIDALRPHYTDLQILEMVFSIAGNNAINRWKDSLGIPQEPEASRFLTRLSGPPPTDRPLPVKSFLTPTSSKNLDRLSHVAPLRSESEEAAPAQASLRRRPPLESREQVEAALAAARARQPRLPVATEAEARAILPESWPAGPLPQWVLVLANFPRDGRGRILGIQQADDQLDLDPKLRAQVSWIAARQDRAWYAVGHAQRKLRELGASDDEIFVLDGDWSQFTPAEQAAFGFSKKLAATMDLVSDADVAHLREHLSDRDIVQLVHFLTTRAFFNRVTEAAGLQLEQ
ncbi:MAG: hypothetical protein U0836_25380 [Pirellulales bacterium]